MAARAFMEQVRTVILQRRVRETQSRSEPAGVFQSLIAHNIEQEQIRLLSKSFMAWALTSLQTPTSSLLVSVPRNSNCYSL